MLGSASRSNAEAVYAEEPAPGPSPLQYPPTYPLFISARLSQNNSIAHSPLSAFSVVPRFQSARLPLTIPVLPNRSVAPPRSISTIAPPRSPTASRSPHKKAPGKRARSAAPPDPAPPTTRSTKRARLTAEDVELEDEEIKEAFDDVPADDQSRVPGLHLHRQQPLDQLRSLHPQPFSLPQGPAQDIEDSKQVPRVLAPNARSPATSYKTEWSEYEAEVDEIKAHPSAAVVLAERTAVAAKEAVVQIKTLLTVNSTLLARFTHFEADLRTRLKIPPAAGHKDFVQMLVKDVTNAAAGDKDNGGGGGSAEGGA
ncbi:hypothetical protein EKO04_003179 [Ascochyta lentis]|uniref:Uncharacterized protein n=1 Tax=Ascochyta lentis TaxID=205686 RepID=A0A8H7J948_9PLEO|nr:hypothetical protein EKO04_003179 [Ascochyta lentis]